MKLALDTSFLLTALVEGHIHHPRTVPWTEAVASGDVEAQVGWHAAAETWSVLTLSERSGCSLRWRLS